MYIESYMRVWGVGVITNPASAPPTTPHPRNHAGNLLRGTSGYKNG
jgi:hypothetical protein